MKKILTTLFDGSLSVTYYIEITENKRSFIFRPSLYNKQYPKFTLHLIDGEVREEGHVDLHLLNQAKAEITSLLSINLVENVNKQIEKNFLLD